MAVEKYEVTDDDARRLLATYADGRPRIWDAADVYARVCDLAAAGLLTPTAGDAGSRGAYVITDAGRAALDAA